MATVQMPDGALVELPDNADDDLKERIRQKVEALKNRAQPQGGSPTPTPAPAAVERTGESGFVFMPRSGAQTEDIEAREFLGKPEPGQLRATGEQPEISLPRVPQQTGTLSQILGGMANAGATVAEGLSAPQNIAMLPILPFKPAQAALGGMMIKGGVEAVAEGMKETAEPKSLQERIENVGSGLASMGMGALALKEPIATAKPKLRSAFDSMFGKAEPESPTPLADAATKEVEDASQIKTDAQEQAAGVGVSTGITWSPEGNNKFNVFSGNVHTKVELDQQGNVRLRGFIVDRESRGQGLGSKFAQDLVEGAKQQFPEANEAVVWAFPDAEGFWKKQGFTATGKTAEAGEAGTVSEFRKPLKEEVPGTGTPSGGGAAEQVAPTVPQPEQPVILAPISEAAIKMPDGEVFTGKVHPEAEEKAMKSGRYGPSLPTGESGFVDTDGNFLSSDAAAVRAKQTRQMPEDHVGRLEALEFNARQKPQTSISKGAEAVAPIDLKTVLRTPGEDVGPIERLRAQAIRELGLKNWANKMNFSKENDAAIKTRMLEIAMAHPEVDLLFEQHGDRVFHKATGQPILGPREAATEGWETGLPPGPEAIDPYGRNKPAPTNLGAKRTPQVISDAGEKVWQEAKAAPDEFTGVDATDLSPADRRELAGRGLSFTVDRKNRVIATYPQRLRVEDRRTAVTQKQKARLLPGEKQGDLISSTQEEPLKLVGEEAVDHEARQLEAEAAAEEKANAEKGQMTFEELAAKAQKEEERRLQKAWEDEQLAMLEEHQSRGGDELLDVLKSHGLPVASETTHYHGELEGLRGMFDRGRAEAAVKLTTKERRQLNQAREEALAKGDVERAKQIKEKISASYTKAKSGYGKLVEGLSKEKITFSDIFRKGAGSLDSLLDHLQRKGFEVETVSDVLDLIDKRLRTGKKVFGSEARAEEGIMTGLGQYGMGAARAGEIPEAPAVAMKNRIVDEDRVKRGLEPLMSEARKGNERSWDEAMRRIEDGEKRGQDVGRQMVDDINNRNKTEINEVDQAVLLHERIRSGNERDMAADRINDPNTSAADKVQARNDWAAAEDRLNETELALRSSGTMAGRALQIRQMLARDDYTYAGIERRVRAAQDGTPITPEQSTKIKELSDRIAELEKQLSEKEAAATETEHQQAFDTELTGLKKRGSREGGGEEIDLETQREKLVSAIIERASEGDAPESIGSLVHQLALNFVRSGITEREALIDAVHSVVGEPFDIARHVTRDLISGYGQFKMLDPELAKGQLRQLKGEMQQISKIEDMAGGEAPKKTGIERRTPSDEERRLIRQVNEMKKAGGFEVTDPARQLKSALDAVKTRLTNQIRDLHNALATRKPIEVRKNGIQYDAEAEKLRGMRDALKAQYDEIFGGKGLTDEQRLRLAEGAAERSLKEWDKRLADAKQGKFEGQPARQPVTSTKLELIRAQREALKAEVEALQKVSPTFQALKEQKALALRKANLTRRIADLQDKLDRGDFRRQPKRVAPEDAKTVELQNQVGQLKTKVERAIAKAEFDNQPWIIRGLQHTAGLARMSALSGYHTLGKLFGFSVGHILEKPFTEAVGAALEKTPGFKAITEKADVYRGGHVQALATYYRTLFTKGISEATEYLRTGTSGEEFRYGKPYRTPTHWYDFVGTIHGAEKTPITTAAREMFRQRAIENAIRNGQNPNDPIVRAMINQKTFDYANWEKLQENNKFAEGVNGILQRMEAVDPKTGRASVEKSLLSSVIQTFFTKGIIKTPANFAKQLLMDYSPVGLARGTSKAVAAHIRGIETLTNHEANSIVRLMQVGSVGTAMMLWGMLDALRDPKDRIFGGFYQPGQKRDPDDVAWGSTRIGNQTFHVLAHSMLTEPAQFGSTIVRVAKTLRSKSSGETKGALEGIVSAALYPLENAPVANPITRTERYVQQGKTRKVVSDIVRGLIPQLVQNIAEDTDMLHEPKYRTPKTFTQDIEMGLPGLRQRVPTNEESSRGGGITVRP